MLVLSRKIGEKIMLGDDIVVTLVDIRGDKIRLGFDAPVTVPVYRQEVYEAIKREQASIPPTVAEAATDEARSPSMEEYVSRALHAG